MERARDHIAQILNEINEDIITKKELSEAYEECFLYADSILNTKKVMSSIVRILKFSEAALSKDKDQLEFRRTPPIEYIIPVRKPAHLDLNTTLELIDVFKEENEGIRDHDFIALVLKITNGNVDSTLFKIYKDKVTDWKHEDASIEQVVFLKEILVEMSDKLPDTSSSGEDEERIHISNRPDT